MATMTAPTESATGALLPVYKRAPIDLVRGEGVELHQVMASAEEASLSLDLMVELRNKVTEAYKTLVNMQS